MWPLAVDALVPKAHFDGTAAIKPHTEYQHDPIGWAEDKLGIPAWMFRWHLTPGGAYEAHEWDGTVDPLAVAFQGIVDWKDVAVESGTGLGKSFGAAVLILWFLACFENSEVYTFAPKEDQLRLFIWKGITALWPKFCVHFPFAIKTDLTIRMRGGQDETWAAHGFPVGLRAGETVSVKASGMHAEHLLLVYEEAAAIAPAVMEAGKNTCTAPHNMRIAIGNPSSQDDVLHAMAIEEGVVAVRVSARDHPNVVAKNPALIPGAISIKSIEKRLADYGEDDPIYLARVRGISPEQAANALIRLEWILRANERYMQRLRNKTLPFLISGKGVDVANSEHGDEAAIADFAENVLIRVESFACPDANLLGDRVVKEMGFHRYGHPPLLAVRVGVDAIGVGAGTVNEMRRQKVFVQGIQSGGKPVKQTEKAPDGQMYEWAHDANRFKNLRAQMWWQMREDLRENRIDLVPNEKLQKELVSVTYEDNDNVVIVEPKDDIRKRLGHSPNLADCTIYGNWVRHRAKIVKDVDNGEKEGVSLGYDHETHRPRERKTGEQELAEMLGLHGLDPLSGRNLIPYRKIR